MTNFIAPVIIVALAVALVYYANVQRKKEGFVDYDERQLFIRGNAYKYGFFAVLVYGVLYFLFQRAAGQPFMQDGVAVLLSVLIGIVVFATYSILKGAQFTSSSPMKSFLILYAVVILTNLLSTGIHIHEGDMIQGGVLADPVIYPATALAFFVVFIATLVQGARDKRAEAEEAEDLEEAEDPDASDGDCGSEGDAR